MPENNSDQKAPEPVSQTGKDAYDLLLILRLTGREYALMASCVKEIIRMRKITRVPGSPRHIDGVINLRGRIIPVVSLRRRLELPEVSAGEEENQTIIVVESGGHDAGFVVDSVSDVVEISEKDINHSGQYGAAESPEQFVDSTVKLSAGKVDLLRIKPLLEG